ncbi:LysM peptidoglycan-binding domain-containing protein [Planococcus salinus]|uniref:LysM peptidoglycan-binding domain-containing protein n=1 Tax=Planococcus salinus TaxID=1848460 RepID=A0A3M8P8K7_9BACL|nr:LysM peptidoglycan-binding domain-containing protein [Planococcus salinus]RNF39590.1 LysM peptidoglycan-binding domain-containing protein [Planococcus salinus]
MPWENFLQEGFIIQKKMKLSSGFLAAGLIVGAGGMTAQAETATVQAGDTFWGLAQEHNVSVQNLMEWNSGIDASSIPVGAELIVSMENGSSIDQFHTIKRGDTFNSIADLYPGVTLVELFDWNPDVHPNNLQIGSDIRIQAPDFDSREEFHTIEPGETLYSIANLHTGVTLAELYEWNPGINPYNLEIGSDIRVSG